MPPISRLICEADTPAASSFARICLKNSGSGSASLGVLGEVIGLELHVRHAVLVHVVLRQVQEVDRLRRPRIGRPRQLEQAAESKFSVISETRASFSGRDVRAASAAAPRPLAPGRRRQAPARRR